MSRIHLSLLSAMPVKTIASIAKYTTTVPKNAPKAHFVSRQIKEINDLFKIFKVFLDSVQLFVYLRITNTRLVFQIWRS